MEVLLTAIVVWLSTNFALPASFDHPRLKFVSAAELNAPLRGKAEGETGGCLSSPNRLGYCFILQQ